MVRQSICYYECNHCGVEFNHPRDTSVNIPNLNIKQFNAHFAYPHRRSENGRVCWQTQPLVVDYTEHHFCDETCLAKWIGKKLREAQAQCAEQILDEATQPVQGNGKRMQQLRRLTTTFETEPREESRPRQDRADSFD